ncbi:winged helix-turn-helix domain-containing protein [Serratia oryzae]|nr:winged helix-turn-helix domain-containing protein [Serratia oryzae]
MTSPQDIVQLNAPTSRCFEILLANRYSVISQKVLFESVWGKQGAYVSANTLYQNISLLRKALKSLDLDGIVKTISKQGIVIADTVSVQEIENDNVDLSLPSATLATVSPTAEIAQSTGIQKWLTSNLFLGILVTLALGLVTLFILENHQHQSHMGYFNHYSQFTEINGCAIFKPEMDNSEERYLSFVKNYPIPCAAQSKVYLTMPRAKPQVSMLICDKDILTPGVRCHSYNLLREVNYD